MQRNSKGYCIPTGSHVHAGKAIIISENNGLRIKNLQILNTKIQILFLSGISWWWKVEKEFYSLIFWKHGAVNEFYGAIDISYQIRGAEFPVIRVLEKPKLLHSGTCTSTSTRHVNFKSPLLLQFPYCELCDNDNRQSNYRLMNVLFCTRALFPDFSKSSK